MIIANKQNKYSKVKKEKTNTKRIQKTVEILIPGIFAIAFISIYTVKSQGLSIVLTFGLSMFIAYVLYLLTSVRTMPEPDRVLPLYLLALGTQLLHFIEEFTTGFHVRFPVEIYGSVPFQPNMFVISQMSVYFLLIITAIGIFKGWKIPMVMAWFLIIMLLFVNAIQHPIYAIITKGYFPGLYTSFAEWILGPILFKRMWEVRQK